MNSKIFKIFSFFSFNRVYFCEVFTGLLILKCKIFYLNFYILEDVWVWFMFFMEMIKVNVRILFKIF